MLASVTGAAGEVRTEQFDIDLKRRGGQGLPVRLLHRIAFSHDGQPGPSRTLVISRAPGEEPGEDLRAAEVRFARVFNATPVAIAITDSAGAITQSNAAFARMMPAALSRRAVDGATRSIYSAITERDRPHLERAIRDASAMKSDITPVDITTAGDNERSARLFVSASGEPEGGGATIYALDTTEQRTLKENFAQSQKMQAIGQLAGGVAHDFNNVLTAIIGYSDLLLANHRPTDPSFQDIMQIKQNANRAAGLVRQLLAFSRRQTLRPQVLQLGDVMSELLNLMRRLVGEKVELDLRHGRDLWLVKADINQFEQVIINLVVNARDAMPSGGTIKLSTKNVPAEDCASFKEDVLLPGDYVAIAVADNGTGIPPEVREKIFEPFFTTKEVGKGTGLGLSMVYGIVKQTEGYVFCDSEVGRGTTFTILLPRHIATEADEPVKKEAAKPVADSTGHGTILLVEDEEAVRAFGARALTARGYTGAGGRLRARGARDRRGERGQDRPCGLRCRHAGDGRPDDVRRIAKARHQGESDLRLRLRGRRFRQEPARRRGLWFPAEAVLAEAADRGGEGVDGVRNGLKLAQRAGIIPHRPPTLSVRPSRAMPR